MENEKIIRQQMEETRTSLTDKLETLENKVASAVEGVTQTVQEATSAVTGTVENIKESVEATVASVHDTVGDTVSAVKDSVQEGVHTIKHWFDVCDHVDKYPWLMLGGSVLLGYLLEPIVEPAIFAEHKDEPRTAEPVNLIGDRSAQGHHNGNGGTRQRRRPENKPASSGWSIFKSLEPELNKLKGLALGAALGTVREMVARAVPEHLGSKLGEIVDDVTRKMGGNPVPASDLGTSTSEEHPVPASQEPPWRR